MTGRRVSGWAHVQQSIGMILTTPVGSRVMRRDFGSRLFDLIDAKMTPRRVLALYAAVAMALARWEPRFRLTRCAVIATAADGRVGLSLHGTYYPRGHLGDYSIAEDVSARVVIPGAT